VFLSSWVSEVCCFVAVLSPSQRADVNVHGHSSDETLSIQHSVIRDLQFPVAGGQLQKTVISYRAADEAEQPQGLVGKPDSEMLGVAEKGANKQSVNTVQTVSSLQLGNSMSPAIFTGSSLDWTSQQSNTQRPVKLNGISDTNKSLDTCSGRHCLNSLLFYAHIYRASYTSAVLGVVILSVRPSVHLSVRHTRAL